MFTVIAAYVVALPVSAAFFGLAFASFILCVRALCSVPFDAFTRTRWTLLFISCATIIVGAISIGQGIRHNMNAFVYWKDGTAPMEAFSDPQNPVDYIHSITYPIQHFLGDSVLVYRTWIVNNKDWRFIVVPAILVIGGTFSASGIAYSVSRLKTGGYTDPTVVPWTNSFLALSITLNIMCTGMIIYRVLKATRAGPGSTSKAKSPLHLVTRVVIESGLLYTLTSLIMLILNIAGNPAVYIVADSYLEIIPICFNLIIIRTSNLRDDPAYSSMTTGASRTAVLTAVLTTLDVEINSHELRSTQFRRGGGRNDIEEGQRNEAASQVEGGARWEDEKWVGIEDDGISKGGAWRS